MSRWFRPTTIGAMLVPAILLALGTQARCQNQANYGRTLAEVQAKLEKAARAEKVRPGASGGALDHLPETVPDSIETKDQAGRKARADLTQLKQELRGLKKLTGPARAQGIQQALDRVKWLRSASIRTNGLRAAQLRHAQSILREELQRGQHKDTWWNWLMERLSRAGNAVLEALIGLLIRINPRVGNVILIILEVLAVLVLAYVLVRVVLAIVARRVSSTPEKTGKQGPRKQQQRPTTESLLADAERHAKEGRWRDAYRCVYLAAMFLLDRKQLVVYQESGTNWEHTRAVIAQSTPETARIFTDMTSQFDELIYGQRVVSHGDYDAYVSRFRGLEEAA